MILTEKQAEIISSLRELPLVHSTLKVLDDICEMHKEDIRTQCERCKFKEGCDTFQFKGFNDGYCHSSSEVVD